MQQRDVIVLGAGIVGVSTALHLLARGWSVSLVDKNAPGEGASYGNAGLIERSSVVPYSFPQGIKALIKYGLNRQSDMRYDPFYLPKIAPFLFKYWKASQDKPLSITTRMMLPLIEASVVEHDAIIAEAGCTNLIRSRGWIEIYRSSKAFEAFLARLSQIDEFGLVYDILDSDSLSRRQDGLQNVAGAIHWLDPKTTISPGNLVKAYADLFERKGGVLLRGDADTLKRDGHGWQVQTSSGAIQASTVVCALGAYSASIYEPLGYHVPLGIKRGYHQHYTTYGDAWLKYSLVDAEGGYTLAPMSQSIRLTTGIEFAAPDAPVNHIQLKRCEQQAKTLFPKLASSIEDEPWLGLRSCLPDMRPVISRAPYHDGLWFNFGHAHHGLTIGPASGRLLAEMMSNEQPFADCSGFAIDRFY